MREEDKCAPGFSYSWLKWWDVATGRQLASIRLDSMGCHKLAIAPDGATVVTCEDDGVVAIWDRGGKKRTAVVEDKTSCEDVALSPDGKVVMLVTGTGNVVLWDAAFKEKPRTVLARSRDFLPCKATFSSDGKTLAVGGIKGNVRLLNASRGELIRSLDWPYPYPVLIAFSPDSKQFALVGGEWPKGNVSVWNWASGKLLHTFARPSGWQPQGMAFSPDNCLLAVGSITFEVWDLATGRSLDDRFVGHQPFLDTLAFLGQTETVATAGVEGTVRLWDARTGRQKALIRHAGMLGGLAVSPGGKLLASSIAGKATALRIWDASTGKQVRELAGHGNMHAQARLCFSPDAKLLAGACGDGKMRVWSVENGAMLNENILQFPGGFANNEHVVSHFLAHAVFSPDARFLVTEFGGWFSVLSVETGKQLRTFQTDALQQCELAVSPDGKLLLSNQHADSTARNADGTLRDLHPTTHALRLWKLADGKAVWRQVLPDELGGPVCISAGGNRFAVFVRGPSREIRVCDLSSREVLQTLKLDGYARCLNFSSDGRLLAAGMADGSGLVWDLSRLPGWNNCGD